MLVLLLWFDSFESLWQSMNVYFSDSQVSLVFAYNRKKGSYAHRMGSHM